MNDPGPELPRGRLLTFVLAVIGKYQRVEAELARTLTCLDKVAKELDAEIVVGFETEQWLATPLVEMLPERFPTDRLSVFTTDTPHLPAPLFNEGARRAQGGWLLFLWPGCLPEIGSVAAAVEDAARLDLDWLAKIDPDITDRLSVAPEAVASTFLSYCLSATSLFPLCQAIIKRSSFLDIGGFDCSPILQRQFDVEFCLRSAYHRQKVALQGGCLVNHRWTWGTFPFQTDFRVPRYVAHSYRVRSAEAAAQAADDVAMLAKFVDDLPAAEAQQVRRLTRGLAASSQSASPTTPYKLAITGGVWEPAHNHLCFYNYFRHFEGAGLFTYVPLLEALVNSPDCLRGLDAVIISRGLHENVPRIIEYCQQHAVPTIYMIDDNWLRIGADWPDPYAKIYAPGLPAYETFLSCLRECDAVLVYNPLLEADLQPYARRIVRLPVNVRQADFAARLLRSDVKNTVQQLTEWRSRTDGVIIGYAGSVRYSDAAFEALATAARERRGKTKALLFGYVTAEQRAYFDDSAVAIPYLPYEDYAATLGALRPDVLIAPLEACRTAMSKCPNKYLEYSIVGAAGVYSNIPPYSDVISDGVNGLLVPEAERSAWYGGMIRLIDDAPLRRSIAAVAHRDVLTRHETAVVAPQFAEAITRIIQDKSAGSLTAMQGPG